MITIKGPIRLGGKMSKEDTKSFLDKVEKENGKLGGLLGMLRGNESPDLKSKVVSKINITYSSEQLFDMTKQEQIVLLNSLGVEKIPRYEKGRVEAILELQWGDKYGSCKNKKRCWKKVCCMCGR